MIVGIMGQKKANKPHKHVNDVYNIDQSVNEFDIETKDTPFNYVGVSPTNHFYVDQEEHTLQEDQILWYPSQNRIEYHKSYRRLLPPYLRDSLIESLRFHFEELAKIRHRPKLGMKEKDHDKIFSSTIITNKNLNLPYNILDNEYAHVKIMLHHIQTFIVQLINDVRIDISKNPKSLKPVNTNNKKDKYQEPTLEEFIYAFRQTQTLSHYLTFHEWDEDDF
jgi:hypothetical protein